MLLLTYMSIVYGVDAPDDLPEHSAKSGCSCVITYLSMVEGVDAPDDLPKHGVRSGCS